jgi:hypothetical protein
MAGFVGTVICVTQAVSGPAPNGLCGFSSSISIEAATNGPGLTRWKVP